MAPNGEIGSKHEDGSKRNGRVIILSSLRIALLFMFKRGAQYKQYVRAEDLGRDLIRDRHARDRDEKTIGRKNVKRHQSLGFRVRVHQRFPYTAIQKTVPGHRLYQRLC